MPKSCFNCSHLITWDYSGTLEDPPESGWECGHNDSEDLPFWKSDYDTDSEEEFAEYCGNNCIAYDYYNWVEYQKQQTEAQCAFNNEVS